MIMMMMMMMTMMMNTIPYRRTKNHIWDFALMGFWVHPIVTMIVMMIVMKKRVIKKTCLKSIYIGFALRAAGKTIS